MYTRCSAASPRYQPGGVIFASEVVTFSFASATARSAAIATTSKYDAVLARGRGDIATAINAAAAISSAAARAASGFPVMPLAKAA